jgi:hypothetical protein
MIARNYTIPIAEEEDWDRVQASIAPVLAYVIFLYFTECNPLLF